jgi:phage/plasmid-associated DNA primase
MESATGLIDDLHAARTFVSLMGDKIARDDEIVFCFNDKTGMWERGESAIRTAVIKHAAAMVFTELIPDGKGDFKEKKHNYGGDTIKVTAMLKWVPLLVPDTRFIERNGDSAQYKLLFANGIYDMRTGGFTEGFDPRVVFFARLDRKFTPRADCDAAIIDEVYNCLFVKPFLSTDDPANDMGRFYLEFLARSIAGEYGHKKMLVGVGNRNTGKGVTTNAMTATFQGYVSTYDPNNLLVSRVTKDESQKLMWLKPLRLSRLMMANEVDIDVKRPFNGNLINRIASGGDVLTFRGMREEDMKVRWRTNAVVLANDMPPIAPVNEGVLERMRNMRWSKSFKVVENESELAPNELKADPKWSTIFQTNDDYCNAFFWVVADTFKAIYGKMFFDPAIVTAETKEWVGEAGTVRIKEALETNYILTKNEADVVAYDELKRFLAEAGITGLSDTKLGRELTSLGLVKKTSHRFPGEAKVVAARTGIRERTEGDLAPGDVIAHVPGDM